MGLEDISMGFGVSLWGFGAPYGVTLWGFGAAIGHGQQ